jgi:Holliday junction DNA helicase RuvA
MYEFLQGELDSKSPGAVTVLVGGVGYRLRVPLSTYEALPREGAQVRLLTHLHVREDALTLYGFASETERDLFRMLLGVSQIGPMVALRIMSSCSPPQFKRYILDGDVDALKSMVKGVGAKTAQRLVLELKGPMEDLAVAPAERATDRLSRDAVEALLALGESRPAAEKAVRAAVERLGPNASLQELVSEAFSH